MFDLPFFKHLHYKNNSVESAAVPRSTCFPASMWLCAVVHCKYELKSVTIFFILDSTKDTVVLLTYGFENSMDLIKIMWNASINCSYQERNIDTMICSKDSLQYLFAKVSVLRGEGMSRCSKM